MMLRLTAVFTAVPASEPAMPSADMPTGRATRRSGPRERRALHRARAEWPGRSRYVVYSQHGATVVCECGTSVWTPNSMNGPRFIRPRIRVFSQRFRGDFDAVLSPSSPALLRARRRVPLRACPALRGSHRAADRGPPLRPRTSPSRQARRPRETPKGNKASAMGDEDAVMPVGDNVTFENTYMQKPEEFGEVRPDTRHARGSRRRFETDKPDAARRTMPSTRCPIFGTNRDLCGALTRRSSSTSSEPKRRKRDRGTSSCAAPFRKS